MDEGTARQFVSCLGLSGIRRSGKWLQASCPFAPWKHESGQDRNPSFGIVLTEGEGSRYSCFACHEKGDMVSLVRKLRHLHGAHSGIDFKAAMKLAMAEEQLGDLDIPDYEAVINKAFEEKPIVPFPEWWLASFEVAYDHPYLKQRGISRKVAEKYDLRWDSKRNRLCFPVRTFEGELAGLHGRAIDPGVVPKYYAYSWNDQRNPQVWFGEQFADLSKPLMVVEGNVDQQRVAMVYPNVIAAQGAGVNKEKVQRIRFAERIIVWFDPDKAGRSAVRTLCSELPAHDIDIVESEVDPGDTPLEDIQQVIDDLLIVW